MEASYLTGEAVQVLRSVGASGGEDLIDRATAYSDPEALTSDERRLVLHPYAASNRLISLMLVDEVLDSGDRIDVLSRGLFRWVLMLRETDLGFNHLLKNDLAVLLYAVRYCNPVAIRLAGWRYLRTLEGQVLPDGGHNEHTPMYHFEVLADLQAVCALTLPDPRLCSRLTAIEQHMRAAATQMTFSSGRVALFGDSWGPERLVGTGVASNSANRSALRDFGIVRLNSGNSELMMNCGPFGSAENPGHGHDDCLSVEVEVDGELVISDFGVPEYDAGPSRDFSRSAAAHNGPFALERPTSVMWGSFRVGRRYRVESVEIQSDRIQCELSPYWNHEARYRRQVAVTSDGFGFSDSVGNLNEPWGINLLVTQTCELNGTSLKVSLPKGQSVMISWADAHASVEPVDIYRRYAVPASATLLKLRPRSTDFQWAISATSGVETSGDVAISRKPTKAPALS